MRIRTGFAIAVAASTLAAVPATAKAPVQVDIDLMDTRAACSLARGGNGPGCYATAEAQVLSQKKACYKNRKVIFSVVQEGQTNVFDVDRSSKRGYAAGIGEIPNESIDSFKVKVKAKKIGNTKCGAGVVNASR